MVQIAMEDRMTRRPKKTPGAIDGIAAAAIGIDAEAIEAGAVRTADFSKLDALTRKLYGAAAQATKKPLTPTPDEKATIDALKYATRLARASWLERGISEGVRAKRLRHLNRLFWLLDDLDPALLPQDEDQDGFGDAHARQKALDAARTKRLTAPRSAYSRWR
jgi:hypothetical protein